MVGTPFSQRGRTDFLLAFEHELDVARQTIFLDHVFEGFGVHERLPFVIVGTSGIQTVANDSGFKRRGLPKFHRIHRHHIVMAVNQDGLGFGIDDFFTIDHRVPLGRHDLGLVGPGFE